MVRIKKVLRRIYDLYIKRDKKRIAYYKYIDEGGESLRVNYNLGRNSIVIDAGGYHGDFAETMICKFSCRVDVFEPVAQYAEMIRTRFASNGSINVVQAGLGASNKEEFICIEGVASTLFSSGSSSNPKEKIMITSAVDYIKSKKYSKIDLIKINIEGGEYELLNSLLEHPDIITHIKYFQIQFHDFIPGAIKMREDIQERLSITHKKMWDFPFIWESWELK